MTKKKKKKNQEEFLINFLVILGLIAALLLGYVAARHVTEKRIAKHASNYVDSLADTIELTCNNVDYISPLSQVKYHYTIICYYSSAKSQYNSSNIIIDNNGIIRGLEFRIPAETNKSKEENYTNIEDIIARTIEAIETSEADLSKIHTNKKLLESFKAEFDSKSYENKLYIEEKDNESTVYNEFHPQNDETPYVPPYFEIRFK